MLTPVSCCAIAALWAICWGMTHRPPGTDPDYVPVGEGLTLAMLGALTGAGVGGMLYQLTKRWPRTVWLLEIVLCSVLAGSIAAPFGWLTRNVPSDQTGEHSILQFGVIGAIVGLVLAVCIRLCRRLLRARKMKAKLQ